VHSKTESIWSYIDEHAAAPTAGNVHGKFINPQWIGPSFEGALWPVISPKKIVLWERYFLRWDPLMHPSPLAQTNPWDDDWGGGGGGL
jgi:hypothetical protein